MDSEYKEYYKLGKRFFNNADMPMPDMTASQHHAFSDGFIDAEFEADTDIPNVMG